MYGGGTSIEKAEESRVKVIAPTSNDELVADMFDPW